MRNFLTTTTLLFCIVFMLSAQDDRGIKNDPKAQELLDKVSAKYQGMKTLEVVFKMNIISEADGLNESYNGQAYLKNDKYRVSTDIIEIICDNVKRWTVLKQEKEVQVNFYEPSAENIESPTKLFTMYKTGYYFRMDEPETLDGKEVSVVRLLPKDNSESLYKYVLLYIDANSIIRQARIVGKDGVEYLWKIQEFTPGLSIDDEIFQFDPTSYPNFHIEDLTK